MQLWLCLSAWCCEQDVMRVYNLWGAGRTRWLERRTRDRKVAGSIHRKNGGRIFFSRVNFLDWLFLRGQLSGLALSPGSTFWTGSFSGVKFLDWLFLQGQLSGLALSPGSSFWTGSFSRVKFLDWLLFRYPFHPCTTAAKRKRSQSFY